MVPSSSEDVTRAMRGQPKRLSRNYLRRNGGKFGEKSFTCFDFQKACLCTDVFCTLSRTFVRLGFRFFCARLVVYSFAVHSVFESLISKPQWAYMGDEHSYVDLLLVQI